MAYKIFSQFKSPVTSFGLREAHQGILHPGRYRGFDQISLVGSLPSSNRIKLTHSVTGYTKVTEANEYETKKSGIIVFNNGFILHEDGEPELIIDHGVGERLDVITATLNYNQIQDSTTVSYGVQKSGASLMAPGYNFALTPGMIVIGIIRVAASSTAFSGLTYTKEVTPPLALGDALLYPGISNLANKGSENYFLGKNSFNNQVYQKDLVTNRIVSLTTANIDEGYIRIDGAGPNGANEFIMDLGGNNMTIKGFRHSTIPLSTASLTPGTSIKVRFVNPGPSSIFWGDLWDSGVGPNLSGFTSIRNIPIKPNHIYIIRFEKRTTDATGMFSLASSVEYDDFHIIKTKVNDNLGDNVIKVNQVLQLNHNHASFYYSYMGNPTDGYLVTVTAILTTSVATGSITGTVAIPSWLRPSSVALVESSSPNPAYTFMVDTNGIPFINNQPEGYAQTFSVTFSTK